MPTFEKWPSAYNDDLPTMTTFLQWQLFWGPKCGRCSQAWLCLQCCVCIFTNHNHLLIKTVFILLKKGRKLVRCLKFANFLFAFCIMTSFAGSFMVRALKRKRNGAKKNNSSSSCFFSLLFILRHYSPWNLCNRPPPKLSFSVKSLKIDITV